jgi:hypothetical protein
MILSPTRKKVERTMHVEETTICITSLQKIHADGTDQMPCDMSMLMMNELYNADFK